jgi:serine phosphatase RsbU (regulator of sigma subunit)
MKEITLLVIALFFAIHCFGQAIRPLNKSEQDQVDRLNEMAKTYQNNNETINAAKAYSQMAFIYWKASHPREAIESFSASSELFLLKNKFEEARNIYSNIGVIYTDLEELEFAHNYFEKSLEVRRKIGEKTQLAAGLIDVAFVLKAQGYYSDAIEKLEEALTLATDVKNSNLIVECYKQLSENYDKIGNIKKSKELAGKAETYEAFMNEESLKKDYEAKEVETQGKIAVTEEEKRLQSARFEIEQLKNAQKEDSLNYAIRAKQDSLFQSEKIARASRLEIENLNKEKQLQDALLEQQKVQQRSLQIIIASVSIIVLFLIIIAVLMLRSNRARKKANQRLAKQNKEIAEKSEQLGVALKKIAHQNQNITQSINYAKGIQQALLPKQENLAGFLPDSFILFKPRDIVSGDFYWFREIDSKSNIFKIFGMHRLEDDKKNSTKSEERKLIISAIDCTGHGVPGAFMSMIGYNLLDEITSKGINRPNLILEELHRGVRFTLKQRETNNQDGMDLAMCVFDLKARTLEFSGAKNPLVYIQDGEIKQIKGDTNGVGGKSDEHTFTLHTINIDRPTYCYIFSDGYIDQFGGDSGRKFMIGPFRKLLLDIHQKPMKEQQEILEKNIKDWMGKKYNQIDDILVIGFKLDFPRN